METPKLREKLELVKLLKVLLFPSSSAHISSTSPCRNETTRTHPTANSNAPAPKNTPLLKSCFSLFLNSSLRSFLTGGCGLFAGSRSSGSSNEMRGSFSSSLIVTSPLIRRSEKPKWITQKGEASHYEYVTESPRGGSNGYI